MKNHSNILPIILAGGSGTRLWPLSRKNHPKQFLSFNDNEDSLLQATIKRIHSLKALTPIVICNEEHRFLAAEQLRSIGIEQSQIILESIGKNTAPAIAISAFLAKENKQDPFLLVLAADHHIGNENSFIQSIENALIFATKDKLVTFGIVPTKSETGYGYIEKGKKIENGFEINRFIEKPNLINAIEYFESGKYLWNSGMFMFKASRYLQELEKYSPEIYEVCRKASESISKDELFLRCDDRIFSQCPADSIDYAIMEKTEEAVVLELDAQWSDIGSWDSLWDLTDKDNNGNALIGDIVDISSKNCYVYSKDRLVSLLEVEDLIVIDTKDSLLIVNKGSSQEVKKIVERIECENRIEHIAHRVVNRPWGSYDTVDKGDRHQVKRIVVKPGSKLSVQMHYHRAEHWIVVSGTALITNGENTLILSENQSTYIPAGVVHSLENPGKIALEIIEVQSGAYLGEDDIVRLQDRYGRI